MYIANLKSRMTDVPGIEGLTMRLEAGRMLVAIDDRVVSVNTWNFRTASGAVRDIEVEPGVVVPEPDVLETTLLADAGIGRLPDFHAGDAIKEGALFGYYRNSKDGCSMLMLSIPATEASRRR